MDSWSFIAGDGKAFYLALVAVMTVALLGLLCTRIYYQRKLASERQRSGEMTALRSGLDQIELAVALIDENFRARFLSSAYRKIFRVPDEMAARRPSLRELLEHKFDQRVYEIATDKETYVAERLARIENGDERPIDLRLANGEVIRYRCKALANGGWIIIYGNVSDLVHTADELARLATIDSLSGAFNRRHFLSKLEEEWTRHIRYGRPLSLLMLDLDTFKSINDRYGHDAGDEVIRRLASLCSNAKRDSDTFARLGGEEFALLLPETGLSEACDVAERLRSLIEAERWPGVQGRGRVTASIGVAEAQHMSAPAELYKKADRALYAAKRAGRNRIAAADIADAASAA